SSGSPAAHAQTCRLKAEYFHFIAIESRRGAKSAPILGYKRAQKRHRPIVLHKRMQSRRLRKPAKKMVGKRRARKVVHEPPQLRMLFHPSHKTHHLFVEQVVREQ